MNDKTQKKEQPLAQDGWSVDKSRTGSRGAQNSGKLSNNNFVPAQPVKTTPKPK